MLPLSDISLEKQSWEPGKLLSFFTVSPSCNSGHCTNQVKTNYKDKITNWKYLVLIKEIEFLKVTDVIHFF